MRIRVVSHEGEGCSDYCDAELPCMRCRYRAQVAIDDGIIKEALEELGMRRTPQAKGEKGDGR